MIHKTQCLTTITKGLRACVGGAAPCAFVIGLFDFHNGSTKIAKHVLLQGLCPPKRTTAPAQNKRFHVLLGSLFTDHLFLCRDEVT